MPPKRRRSSINPATVPIPAPPSPSKIPRRKSITTTTSAAQPTANRRRSSLAPPTAGATASARDKITPRNSLADADTKLPKPTPYTDLRQLAGALASQRAQEIIQPTPRRPPQTPRGRTPAAPKTPGTQRRTPRTTNAVTPRTVATPHTARAVKQLQLTVGRSGGVKSARRAEIRRESQRDILKGLSRVLAKETTSTVTTRLNDTRNRANSSSSSPGPPELTSRLSTPSSDDDLRPPRMSLSHDPPAPTHTLRRTPPGATGGAASERDDTIMSVEEARRAPVQRLSDRLSFGAVGDMGSDVDDTMMDILANRPTGQQFDDNDDTFDMRMDDDDTVDIRANLGPDVDGDYTEALRLQSPSLQLDLPLRPTKPKSAKLKTQKISRHGVVIPPLPTDLIRNLAQQFSSRTISKDALPQIERATDEFFRNISSDLATFAKHAGRKGIEESDVQMLLQRQRQIKPQGAKNSVFSVAQKFLPGELLGRVRMVKGGIQKRKGRAPRGRNVDNDDHDD